MSGGNRSYIGKTELRKIFYMEFMKHNRQLKDEFRGREAQYEAVSTQNPSCGKARIVFLAITPFSVVNFSLKILNKRGY